MMIPVDRKEEQAIAAVIAIAKEYGYGNLISHLKREWAESLVRDHGLNARAAIEAADTDALPLRNQG